jgi:hypothetical protein
MPNRVLAPRRQFLETTLRAGAAALAMPCLIPGSVLGKEGAAPPSEQIVLGGLGIGGRGSYVLGCFMQQPDVRVVACADPRADRRGRVKQIVDAKYGQESCAEYRDFRELLARPDIDAVLITTGSNWHALLSIASTCASGPTGPTTPPRSSTPRSRTARPTPATPTA